MNDTLGYVFIGILLVLFFYFGYRDDYKRDKRGFVKTIIRVPLMFLNSILGIFGMDSLLEHLLEEKEERKKIENKNER